MHLIICNASAAKRKDIVTDIVPSYCKYRILQLLPLLFLILTSDKEVGEDQEAAAAEADGTVGGGE